LAAPIRNVPPGIHTIPGNGGSPTDSACGRTSGSVCIFPNPPPSRHCRPVGRVREFFLMCRTSPHRLTPVVRRSKGATDHITWNSRWNDGVIQPSISDHVCRCPLRAVRMQGLNSRMSQGRKSFAGFHRLSRAEGPGSQFWHRPRRRAVITSRLARVSAETQLE